MHPIVIYPYLDTTWSELWFGWFGLPIRSPQLNYLSFIYKELCASTLNTVKINKVLSSIDGMWLRCGWLRDCMIESCGHVDDLLLSLL